MARRGRHPSFGPDQRDELLQLMGKVRQMALLCGAAAGHNSDRCKKTDDLNNAIDTMAEEFTGNRKYYWDRFATGDGSMQQPRS